MATVMIVTHPEVIVDPARPVPSWRLSERDIARMRGLAERPGFEPPAAVWASREVKAIEAAGLLAAPFGLPVGVDEDLGENDRSATGFLPAPEFERTADAFFATPDESVRGWERAVDAQARMRAAVASVLRASPAGDVVIVTHGGVGTLLLCHLLGLAITRAEDQRAQGHVFRFERETGTVLHRWRSIEAA